MTSSQKCLLSAALLLLISVPVQALITGMMGNTKTEDRDWPAGALELANLPNRLGYWEGPPFGGGEYHFLYRGDTATFQKALDQFAKIRPPERRLVINEGKEESSWLRIDKTPNADAHVDWTFVVWTPRSWHTLNSNPQNTFPLGDVGGAFRNSVPPPALIVNVAGPDAQGIDWSKIKVPGGLTTVDERATSTGYTRDEGSVLRGDVYDIMTSKPIPSAQIILGQYKEQKNFETIAQALTDDDGHFELKHITPGSYRVTVSAEDHIARTIGYDTFGQNTLKQHIVQLAAPITVKGTVKTKDGKPLSGIKIRGDGILAMDGRGYLPADPPETITNAQGNFTLTTLPEGYFHLFASDSSHQQLDVFHLYGPPHNGLPTKTYTDIALLMTATGTLKGKVLSPDGKPNPKATVDLTATGDHPTNWGGGMNVHPDGSFEFTNVPPGQYLISTGFAPPGSKDPAAKPIEIMADKTVEIQLTK